MRAGHLDRKIVIQEAVKTRLPSGAEKETWEPKYELYAQVLPMRGDERFAGDQKTAVVETRFKIRFREGISALNRILYNGKEYDIVTQPLELGRREGLEIWAKARAEG